MDFFKQLAAKFPEANLRINIMGKNGKYTVSVVPGIKEKDIRPITATGTPDELDEGFLDGIENCIKEAGMMLNNIEGMKADIKQQEEELKKKKEEKKPAAGKPKSKSAPDSEEDDTDEDDTEKSEGKTKKEAKPPKSDKKPETPKAPVNSIFER